MEAALAGAGRSHLLRKERFGVNSNTLLRTTDLL